MLVIPDEYKIHCLEMYQAKKDWLYILKDMAAKFRLKQVESLYHAMRICAEHDLYFWNYNIMGYVDMRPQPHREISDFLMFCWNKLLLLVPRDTFKSSVCTTGQTLRDLAVDVELQFGIWSASEDQVKKKTMELQAHMERNDIFRWLYGDWVTTIKWTENQMIIAPRKSLVGAGMASVSGWGIDAGKAGIHYDIAVFDDPHDESNTGTKEQVEKTVFQFNAKTPMLKDGGKERVVGTRWHAIDIYSRLMDTGVAWTPDLTPEDITNPNTWVYYHRGCYDGPTKVFFSARYSRDKLESIRERFHSLGQGRHFTAQYVNEIVDDEHAIFKSEWLDAAWTSPEKEWEDTYLFDLLVDAAYTEKQSSDFTALILVGSKTGSPTKYVVDWDVYRTENTTTILNRLAGMCQKHAGRFRKIYMQKAAAEEIYIRVMQETEMYRQWSGRIETVSVAKQAKEARIRGLIVPFETQNLKIHAHLKQTPAGQEFMEEYRLFPRAAHDDLLDALAMINQLPATQIARPKKKRLFWTRRMKKR